MTARDTPKVCLHRHDRSRQSAWWRSDLRSLRPAPSTRSSRIIDLHGRETHRPNRPRNRNLLLAHCLLDKPSMLHGSRLFPAIVRPNRSPCVTTQRRNEGRCDVVKERHFLAPVVLTGFKRPPCGFFSLTHRPRVTVGSCDLHGLRLQFSRLPEKEHGRAGRAVSRVRSRPSARCGSRHLRRSPQHSVSSLPPDRHSQHEQRGVVVAPFCREGPLANT